MRLDTRDVREWAGKIRAGERVSLSGPVYIARDAAHKRFAEIMASGGKPPFKVDGATVYYAGPTPARPGMAIGSCGPTTSGRMDPYTPALLDMGLKCMIGKGARSREVAESMIKNGAVYLCALGGAGALAARHIVSSEVIAFGDLGCEAVLLVEFDDMPLYVAMDAAGGNVYGR